MSDGTQIVVWRGTIVEEGQEQDFTDWVFETFGCEGAEFLETFETLPGEGGPGGRTDLMFTIRGEEDIGKFAVPRLAYGMSWWEDLPRQLRYHHP